MADSVGSLRERLTVLQNVWPVITITSLTRSGTTATAVTQVAHGYQTGEFATIAGASPSGYNGNKKITVVDTVTFTFTVDGSLTTPATNAITAQYFSAAQGGKRANWTTLVSGLPAEMIPLSTAERLQVAAIQSINAYNFRVRTRTDLSPKMRVQWTPRWPPGMPTDLLEINGIQPWADPWSGNPPGAQYSLLTCSGVAS